MAASWGGGMGEGVSGTGVRNGTGRYRNCAFLYEGPQPCERTLSKFSPACSITV